MPDEKSISDSSLALRIREGSNDAFRLLYHRYSKKLYYFSLRILCSSAEAEELVQYVFINVWEHRESLNENLSVKNYIYRSAVNYIYNYMKKKAVRTRFLESEFAKNEIASDSTYEQVFFHDLERSIIEIVNNLPPQQQQIFYLSRFEGLSHEKIAGKLKLSVRSVENQIYRALKVVRVKLKENLFLLLLILKAII
jgi:RNA polymerase sigma-70 factor (ECF subfamily)